jgi:hypothetical protein
LDNKIVYVQSKAPAPTTAPITETPAAQNIPAPGATARAAPSELLGLPALPELEGEPPLGVPEPLLVLEGLGLGDPEGGAVALPEGAEAEPDPLAEGPADPEPVAEPEGAPDSEALVPPHWEPWRA